LKRTEILDTVYATHGTELNNCRSEYSAQTKSTVPVLEINKRFGSWSKFYLAYTIHCMEARNAAQKTKKVTKEGKGNVTKN
jgi:hypothetical protein